ncbi:MAG: hypothetical protein AAGC67_03450 [Myxococcota bacterium]
MSEAGWAPALAICTGGAALTGAYARLAVRSLAPSGATLADLAVVSGVFLVVLAGLAAWTRRGARPLPSSLILGFAVLFHAIGLAGAPILEDDPARYRLDGWVFAERGSPYGIAPERFFDVDVPLDVEALLDEVNHPAIPTIYGPTLQWIFRGAHAVAGTALWPIQAAMALGSLALLWLVRRDASPLALAFLAWHPLWIKEFAFTAHPDALAVALLLAAETVRRRNAIAAGGLLGLAVGAKLFAVLALPWIIGRAPRAALAFGATLAALYAPFLATLLAPSEAPDPHAAMGLAWIFNAPAHVLLTPILGTLGARGLLALGALLFLGALLLRDARRGALGHAFPGQAVFGTMLFALPVLNPWYVIWPLAWWARRPTAWLATASVVVLASYAHGLHLEREGLDAYVVPLPVLAFETAAVAIAGLWDARRGPRRTGAARFDQSRSL